MTTLNKLLDKARDVCRSDRQLAKRLGVSPSAVSLWRSGGKITAPHVAKLLELTHQDPALVVQVMQEQDAPPEERRMWSAVWDRLSPVTTVIGVALLIGFAPQTKADPGATLTDAPPMHYAKSAVRAITRRVRDWLARWSRQNAPSLLAAR